MTKKLSLQCQIINLFIFFSFFGMHLVTFLVKLTRELSGIKYCDLSVSFPRLYLHCRDSNSARILFLGKD